MASDGELLTHLESDYSIIDRHGITYRVHSERATAWILHLWHDNDVVGYMNCIEQSPVLLIGDFQLYDNVRIPESVPAMLWRKFLRRPPPVRTYRHRGLGTAMFALLSALAKSAGFSRLEGWISDVDTKDNPGLLDWYRCRGFTVTAGPSKYPHQVATIRKDF